MEQRTETFAELDDIVKVTLIIQFFDITHSADAISDGDKKQQIPGHERPDPNNPTKGDDYKFNSANGKFNC